MKEWMAGKVCFGIFVCVTLQSSAAAADKAQDTARALVLADRQSMLSAQMTGRILSVGARLGDRVGAGALLFQFDCEEQEARLKMSKAEWDGAKSTLEAKTKLQAMQSASILEVSQAAADVEKFGAQTQLYQAQNRQCRISAPFAGRISKLNAKAFESVSAGQPLLELVNDSKLKAQLNVPSAWLAQMRVGHRFAVRVDETGKSYEAKVSRINAKVDSVSQSVEIEGEFIGRTDDLLPGMSGTGSFSDYAKK